MNKLILISLLLVGLGAVSVESFDWGLGLVRKLGNGILDAGAGAVTKMGLPGADLAMSLIDKTRNLGNGIVDKAGSVVGVEVPQWEGGAAGAGEAEVPAAGAKEPEVLE